MRWSAVVPVAVLAALLVGCSGPVSDAGSLPSTIDVDAADVGVVAPGEDAAGGGDTVGDLAGGGDVVAERQVVTTASTSLTVEDPADVARRVSELVESTGGRVEERAERSASPDTGVGGAVADLVVRVPADSLTGVLADLAEFGEVQDVSVSRSDVTATAVDLDARIAALQVSVDRLQGLLAGAGTTAALLEAEAALADRQAEVESLQSQRALLADEVELATLSVHLDSAERAEGEGPGFTGGVATGWQALVSALSATLVVVGVLLPWLVVGALVAGVVLVSLRWYRSRASVGRVAEPAAAEPATGDPATADPATADPATADPATADPATDDPVADRSG